MPTTQHAVVSAARRLIGVRFRPQGRDPDYGLDCVGVVLAALAGAGKPVRAPQPYALRGGNPQHVADALRSAGLTQIGDGEGRAGDILLMQAGPMQLHLGIRTSDGIVHADAGLRRVVEAPGAPRWPIMGTWRTGELG